MAFKTFVAGDVLTAAEVNTYLMKQAVIICTAATRPSSPVEGMTIYETDTDKMWTWDGSTWNLPKNVHGGVLGFVQTTTAQSGITDSDLTGLSVAVTVGAGRRICISYFDGDPTGSVGGDTFGIKIQESTTVLQRAVWGVAAANQHNRSLHVWTVLAPSAGAHTYKIRATREAGTGTIGFARGTDTVGTLLVEDIGGA